MMKYYPKVKPSSYTMPGYLSMKITEVGLRKAGRNLTREGIVEALESLKDYDIGLFKVNYGPSERLGHKRSFFTRIKDGNFVKITDFRAPK